MGSHMEQHSRRRTPTHRAMNPVSWMTVVVATVALASSSSRTSAFVLPSQSSLVVVRPSAMSALHATRDRLQSKSDSKLSNNNMPMNGANTENDGDSDADKESSPLHHSVNGEKAPLPGSPLDMLCKDQEVEETYELRVGRALDILRKDYPHILTDKPDFSIYDSNVEVIDPSGVKLHGLTNYKNAFRLMHAIVQLIYCPERSGLQFRLCYDTARQNIRVSWNAEVIPKALFGGVRTTLHVDGISVYEISRKTGKITQHRIERLIMNDTAVQPKQGIFAVLRNQHDESIPVWNSQQQLDPSHQDHPNADLDISRPLFEFRPQTRSKLFSDADKETALRAVSAGGSDGNENAMEGVASSDAESYPELDWEALDRKNQSRKKFGLPPLTPEQFIENEAIVRQMQETKQRQQAASSSAAAEMASKSSRRSNNFLDKLFGDLAPPSNCESNYDCERPEVCCDLIVRKVCCAAGGLVSNKIPGQPRLVPVPVDISDDFPGGRGPSTY